MNFTFHLVSLLGVIILKCVFASPYGFGSGRQEDAVVIDAAPSFSPVSSDSGYPAHNPVYCRHRIHYTPSSHSSVTNTRQNYQQQEPITYQPFNNPAVVRIRQYPSSNSYETYRTPSAPSSNSYETKYETYRSPSVPSSSSYETKYETYRSPSVPSSSSYETKYETYHAPSSTIESPQPFRPHNNDIQESSHINQHDYEQTGSSYEAFMVPQGSARMVMGYRLAAPSSSEPKFSSSYY
ncbi:hypothetical protein OUZ56_015355 [Daphnia magna]|uniref:Uncharacterized protein n=1 Tax=Daphnia magna TaxID=35525 RepID=A0ABR0AMM2_9CRUS|nr:hypothetical protein OUZ56_015355 [Daphnia magna]